MKLILAISVVIIALSVLAGPSSAETEESSVRAKFNTFTDSVKEVVSKAKDKIKDVYKHASESDIATKTRNWFSDVGKKINEKFSKK